MRYSLDTGKILKVLKQKILVTNNNTKTDTLHAYTALSLEFITLKTLSFVVKVIIRVSNICEGRILYYPQISRSTNFFAEEVRENYSHYFRAGRVNQTENAIKKSRNKNSRKFRFSSFISILITPSHSSPKIMQKMIWTSAKNGVFPDTINNVQIHKT